MSSLAPVTREDAPSMSAYNIHIFDARCNINKLLKEVEGDENFPCKSRPGLVVVVGDVELVGDNFQENISDNEAACRESFIQMADGFELDHEAIEEVWLNSKVDLLTLKNGFERQMLWVTLLTTKRLHSVLRRTKLRGASFNVEVGIPSQLGAVQSCNGVQLNRFFLKDIKNKQDALDRQCLLVIPGMIMGDRDLSKNSSAEIIIRTVLAGNDFEAIQKARHLSTRAAVLTGVAATESNLNPYYTSWPEYDDLEAKIAAIGDTLRSTRIS